MPRTQNAAPSQTKRRRVPKTAARSLFSTLNAVFRGLDIPAQAAWNALGSRMTPA